MQMPLRFGSGPGSGPDRAGVSRLAPAILAACSTVAGIIHLAVAPEHFLEWWAAGAFFVVVGVAQLVWAGLALARPGGPVAWTGLGLNLGVLAVWAASRTVGLPFGPHRGSLETVGPADLAASSLEAAVVVGALALLLGSGRGRAGARRATGMPAPLRAAAVALATTILAGGLAGVSFGSDANRPHPINANEGYGDSKVVRFTYPMQYVCTTEAFDDLDGPGHQGDGRPAAVDPDEFQVPPCIIGETENGSLPRIAPDGDPIANTEPVWVIVPFFDADHDGIIDAEDPEPGVDTQCPEPGPPYTQHTGLFGTCSMHPSLLHGEPAGLADVPLPNHSHVIDGVNFGTIWWWIISVRVFDERIWPNFNGKCPARPRAGGPPCLTSLEAIRAAQTRGRAGPDVPTNLFLLFDSREVDLAP